MALRSALPEAKPTAIARLYLPAIAAGAAVEAPVEAPKGRPQAAAEKPAAPRPVPPPPAAPLQLPDPRLDVPRSAARAPSTPAPPDASQGSMASSFDDTPSASAGETSSLLAAGMGGLELASEATPADSVPADLAPADQTARWVWPVHGEISQFFSSSSHRGIDIVAEHGEVVVVADRGEVVYAKWESSGLGYLVVIDHGDGYRTYYGHLYGFYVGVGQVVERGDLVGELGSTGNSTGPHLHFEMRHLGVSRDPLNLLPPG